MKCWSLCLWGLAGLASAQSLPDLQDLSQWRLQVSEGGQARVARSLTAAGQPALCMQWEFPGTPGTVQLLTERQLLLPENLRVELSSYFEADPGAQISVQLGSTTDAAWMAHRPADISAAWSHWSLTGDSFVNGQGRRLAGSLPSKTPALALRAALPVGGRGQWCIAGLHLRAAAPDMRAFEPVALADTANALQHRMVDGRQDTFWISTGHKKQTLSLDLGEEREIGGIVVQWAAGMRATDYRLQVSRDGRDWQAIHRVRDGQGTVDRLRLVPQMARFLRLDLEDGSNWRYGIVELTVQRAAWGRDRARWLGEVLRDQPANTLPAALNGSPVTWTTVSAPGAVAPALFSAQGILEPLPGQFTVEPWVKVDTQWIGPADAQTTASLSNHQPVATWQHGRAGLETRVAPGRDAAGRPWLAMHYTAHNPAVEAADISLALLIRPFLLQPEGIAGDMSGGVGNIQRLRVDNDRVLVNDRLALVPATNGDSGFATHWDAGVDVVQLRGKSLPTGRSVDDPQGLASGALLWRGRLGAGERRTWVVHVPLQGQGISAVAAPQAFQAMPAPLPHVWPGESSDRLSGTWDAALRRIAFEQAAGWLRLDSRLGIGAANRDGMMLADALWRGGAADAVMHWLSSRRNADSLGRCGPLLHALHLSSAISRAGMWPDAALPAWQNLFAEQAGRLMPDGECGLALSADALLQIEAERALWQFRPAGLSPSAPGAPALPGQAAGLHPASSELTAYPPLLSAGGAPARAERRTRWRAAQTILSGSDLPSGWRRWRDGAGDGLLDARQAAGQLQALAAVWMDDSGDSLRLLPGVPAEYWGDALSSPPLGTRWGLLQLSAQRDGNEWRIELNDGFQWPPGGLVIDWPLAGMPSPAWVDGSTMEWQGGRLHLPRPVKSLRLPIPLIAE